MRRLLREPLLHFLLLGAAIFAAFRTVGRADGPQPGRIVITQARIETLATTFARTWRRPPTAAELDGLVHDYVREEIFAREAMALGLDKEDTVIRRRLRQKLEFVSEDVATQADPTEEQLRAYLNEHPAAFSTDRRFTFKQVHLDPARRRESLAGDAAKLLERLRWRPEVDVSALGDSLLLEARFQDRPAGELEKQFGKEFTSRLVELPVGRWEGPIESGYGVHLILVQARTEGRVPALGEVRDAVRREWSNARRLDANQRFYQALLQRYTVLIEERRPAEAKQVADARR